MKVILLSDVENLGLAGDIVTVKPGYARNRLIPQGIALRASNKNVAVASERKKVASVKLERENIALQKLAKKLSNVEITIEVNVGEEEKMFGSITNLDVHKELTSKGFDLDKSQIIIDEPIKALGIYHAKVKIAKDIASDVKLYVIKG
jgi:large subunit ribosomal protein L9